MVLYFDDIVRGIILLAIVKVLIVFIFPILSFWNVITSLIIYVNDIFEYVIKVNRDLWADVFILSLIIAFGVIIIVVRCSF